MKILVVGGTRFFGRFFTEAARDAGHEVTVFHRGTTKAPSGVTEIVGDRRSDLPALPRDVDIVLDTCAYHASDVRRLAGALDARVRRYAVVSSVSVYRPESGPWHEDAPLREPIGGEDEITGDTFGGLKVAVERAALAAFGRDRTIVVRPGLIVGPRDTSNRFGYWPRRFARPGRILAPGDGSLPLRFIDARDLARFVLLALERGDTGIFNADGPGRNVRFDEFLALVAGGVPREIVWVPEEFLVRQEVGPWFELPLWEGDDPSLDRVVSKRAIAAGLTYTPLERTIADAAAWEAERGDVTSANLTPEKEAAVLAAWDRERALR